jgi:predicted dehydrogenase
MARLPGVRVVAVCDVDSGVAEKVATKLGEKGTKPAIYQDIRKLLEDKNVDVVTLALPIHWHALASVWAMQAGKDVYVEKPVSHNVSEGRRIVEAATRYNRICQCGTQARSSKAIREAIQFIHSGGIGKVELARGLCYKRRESIGIKPDESVPVGVDYDIWLGPAPKRPFNPNRFHYNWHWHWDYGTGDLGNQGIHQMDIARWALNKNELPQKVHAFGGRFGYTDQGETPNTLISHLDFGDAHLVFEVRGLPTDDLKGAKIGDIVYGSEGYVVFTSSYNQVIAFDREGKEIKRFTGDGDHYKNFIEAVRRREMGDLNAPILEGHLSSALCHLGNISYRLGETVPFADVQDEASKSPHCAEAFDRLAQHLTANAVEIAGNSRCQQGKALTIDPKRENFGKDSKANALLTREYRAPFVFPKG